MELSEVLPAQIETMSLGQITEIFGNEGLERRFEYEISKFNESDQNTLSQAFYIAKTLHTNNRIREPYINHVMRVGMRLMSDDYEHYGIKDVEVVVAAILHDAIEDEWPQIDERGQAHALQTISDWFSPRVASLIHQVTNLEFDPNIDKNTQYLSYAKNIARNCDPYAFLIKLSDFTDNAAGLIYISGPKVAKSAKKYMPVVDEFRKNLLRLDEIVDYRVIEAISRKLDLTDQRLTRILEDLSAS